MGQPINGNSDNQNPVETPGVFGISEIYNGVRGITSAEFHGAVVGISVNHSQNPGPGVYGDSDGPGVWGNSKKWHGVAGVSESTNGGAGIYGKGKIAGSFEGQVNIVGEVNILYNNVNIQGGLLQMNGVDIYKLIQSLQSTIANLETRLQIAQNTADRAQNTANSAMAVANRPR